jgi:hypothetical protein
MNPTDQGKIRNVLSVVADRKAPTALTSNSLFIEDYNIAATVAIVAML